MFVVQDGFDDVRHEFHDFTSVLAFLKTDGDCVKVFRTGCVETITVYYLGKQMYIENCTDYSELWMTEGVVQAIYDTLEPEYVYVTGEFLRRFPQIPPRMRQLVVGFPDPSIHFTVSHALDDLEIESVETPLSDCKIQTLRQFARHVRVEDNFYEGRVMDVSDDTDVEKCLSSY